jgi:Zn-dependent protease
MQEEKGSMAFRLFGIPVVIAPSFLIIAAILGAGGNAGVADIAIWVAVVTCSILVHELGHAMTAKMFGAAPHISLMSTGGLTRHAPLGSRGKDIMVILAGPAAGFLFIALLALGLAANGSPFEVSTSLPWITWPGFEDPVTRKILFYLAYINIGWGIVNLFPVLPLDGGQFMQHVLEIIAGERAVVLSLAVSTLTGAAVAGYFYYAFKSVFMLLVFGYLAVTSGTALFQILKKDGT